MSDKAIELVDALDRLSKAHNHLRASLDKKQYKKLVEVTEEFGPVTWKAFDEIIKAENTISEYRTRSLTLHPHNLLKKF